MSTLTKIVSLAKKLKKEAPNKFTKWTDYIKEASSKIKPVVKKAKKVAKKVTKKAKKTYKKHFGETHKDTNSHNVKLSIYSGVNDNNLNELKNSLFLLEVYQSELNSLLKNPNQYPYNELPKKIYNDVIKRLRNNINVKKRQIVQIKKLIN